ncbi:MAG: LytR C-terminal domain-containing protein [Bowdeniella nasicola]|nr:LytR C-terminal domain-containing protein [Bowdeniella nasicola]
MSHYEEDEFDIAARERGTGGAHRRVESPWRRYLPLIVVLIVAPLLAWGVMSLLTKDRASVDRSPAATTPAATEAAEDNGEQSDETDADADQGDQSEGEPSEEPSEEPADFDRTLSVVVLNGAGINQLASTVAAELEAEGFTNVKPGDYGSQFPTVTTIYYHSPAERAAAEAIGEKLGISELVESAEATPAIAIVLRDNPLG